jgi:hypothetical protein
MKRLQARIDAIEARAPRQDDQVEAERRVAVRFVATWGTDAEISAWLAAGQRVARGRALEGDAELVEDLPALWQARAEDGIEPRRIARATSFDARDPSAVYIGDRWANWLAGYAERDRAGETMLEDRATWRRLMAAIDRFVIRREPLPAGVRWSAGDGMPLERL